MRINSSSNSFLSQIDQKNDETQKINESNVTVPNQATGLADTGDRKNFFYNSGSESHRFFNTDSLRVIEQLSTVDPVNGQPENFNTYDIPDIDYDQEIEGDNIGYFGPEEGIKLRISGHDNYVDLQGRRNVVTVEGLSSTVSGSDGRNTVFLTGKGHFVDLRNGDVNGSWIFGRNHTLLGGNYIDDITVFGQHTTVDTGAYTDYIRNVGDGTGNQLYAGEGDDDMHAIHSSNATFHGEEGDDSVVFYKDSFNNTAYGGVGNDSFFSVSGSWENTFYGDDGDDYFDFREGAFDNEGFGGSGDDTFVGHAFHGSEFHGGTGHDIVNLDIEYSSSLVIEPARLTSASQNTAGETVYVVRAETGGAIALKFSGVEQIQFNGGSAVPDNQGGWTLSEG